MRGPCTVSKALLVGASLLALACGGGSSDGDDNGGDSDASTDTGPRQTVFGGDRPVEIIVPTNYDHSTPTPLLFVLHGLGANGTVQAAYTGLNRLPTEREVIVVAPNGTEQTDGTGFWNATDVCCDFENSGVDDSGYLKGLVDEISAVWNVDPNRIFLFGHSNGGFMSFRLACDHADTFAALVSLAGATYLNSSACSPSEPVSVLQLHGTADDTVPYAGSAATPSAAASVSAFATYAGCTPGTLEDSGERVDIDAAITGDDTNIQRASGCPANVSSELWTIENGSHIPSLKNDFHLTVYNWLETRARNQ